MWQLSIVLVPLLSASCLLVARRDYRTRQEMSRRTALLVWVLYFGYVGLMVSAAALGIWPLPFDGPALSLGGAALVLAGAAMFAAGLREFRSFRRSSGLRNDELICTGIYRWSRNPQNTGVGFCLVGSALLGSSGLALLGAGLFWLYFCVYLPVEEAHLERVFGQTYRSYRKRTPRFLGRTREVEE